MWQRPWWEGPECGWQLRLMSGGYTAVLTGRATNSGVGFADLVTDANTQREIQKMRAGEKKKNESRRYSTANCHLLRPRNSRNVQRPTRGMTERKSFIENWNEQLKHWFSKTGGDKKGRAGLHTFTSVFTLNMSGAEEASPLDTVPCLLAGLGARGRKSLCSFFPTSPQLFLSPLADAAVTGPGLPLHRLEAGMIPCFQAFCQNSQGNLAKVRLTVSIATLPGDKDAPPVLHLCHSPEQKRTEGGRTHFTSTAACNPDQPSGRA